MKKNFSKIVAIMPVRMGSKRLKNKNILKIDNKPMFVYVAQNLLKSKNDISFFVSSESEKIKKICHAHNLSFIKRPSYLATDTTEKQEVICHAVKFLVRKFNYKPLIVISLQANTPEFKAKDLDKALIFFKNKLYPKAPIKELISVNPDNIQNGAFRIMTLKAVFQKTLSTKIGVFFTNYLDIHTASDYKKVVKKLSK